MTLPPTFAPMVVIVGDVMLDRGLWGRAERLSPEAPVPVVEVERTTAAPGGAGNVAANVLALGGRPILFGVIGDDAEGDELARLLAEREIAAQLVVEAVRPTTTKTRILAGGHQVLRLDRERRAPILPATETELLRLLQAAWPEMRALVVSDYAKGAVADGLLRGLLERARQASLPVIIDPKRRDVTAYAGATVLTPNAHEAALALGLDLPLADTTARDAAQRLRSMAGVEAVLLTRGEQGMLLATADGTTDLPAQRRPVSDVTGAGDTVVAMLAVALAEGLPLVEAARLANLAAGIQVGKPGTATVSRAEVEAELGGVTSAGKVVGWDEARARVTLWRARGECVVFTNGCFDLLHAGHLYCLEEARKEGDRLVVGLNSDASVRGLKGPGRPLLPQDQRAALLAGLACTDLVVLFDGPDPAALVEHLAPDVLVKGDDYAVEEIAGAAFVLARGGRVVLVPRRPGLSTTDLLRRLDPPAGDTP